MSLPRLAQDVVMRPLFYDALSGEFAPKSDPSKRNHTLGRLVVATFRKGDVVEENYDPGEPGLSAISYSPSWAPNSVARVEGKVISDGARGRFFFANELLLTSSVLPDRVLCIKDNAMAHEYGLVLGDEYGDMDLPLELGENVNLAKSSLAYSARQFFNAAFDAS